MPERIPPPGSKTEYIIRIFKFLLWNIGKRKCAFHFQFSPTKKKSAGERIFAIFFRGPFSGCFLSIIAKPNCKMIWERHRSMRACGDRGSNFDPKLSRLNFHSSISKKYAQPLLHPYCFPFWAFTISKSGKRMVTAIRISLSGQFLGKAKNVVQDTIREFVPFRDLGRGPNLF